MKFTYEEWLKENYYDFYESSFKEYEDFLKETE